MPTDTPPPLPAHVVALVSPAPSVSMVRAAKAKAVAQAQREALARLGAAALAPSSPRGAVEPPMGAGEKIYHPPTPQPAISALTQTVTPTVTLPLRTSRGLNAREHPMARHRRVRGERSHVAWSLVHAFGSRSPFTPPLLIRLTRGAPSQGLDDDNLAGALKSVRDEVASYLGVDDKHRNVVRYAYAQQTARKWWVRIEIIPVPTLTDEVEP